uniref:PIN domain nuclease, a component of toxin-antitoxin system (PIN domain) n=1 Tax=Candidatus Kentrum sp. LPFa TaxID=2126335 RepID=A0A450XB01_9GAMM|nr:MAG: PIN domain nuclease, a component of toxin-antitoxin system (PIN domain) [Candidatus Kentron sp. LPFa]VFK13232.1 MAG: PIN domain nuclease, a component of toxin-antitoxin system (PIN domain) [Candidatus Kentron sp. LPFa]VFK26507.1 MAG: PIN domain nuclease, a component of toxin-antitoxin system (PIN domain) [Candidatus Kentron sp. LPFa]
MTVVLDASALLAFLHKEPGAERVQHALDGALVSSVNWVEVVQKSLERQTGVSWLREGFSAVGVIFEPFTSAQAEIAARLWGKTRRYGLSLADRACISLAMERQLPILTADRIWAEPDLGVEIRLLR